MPVFRGEAARDEIPKVVLDAMAVIDDPLQGVEVEIPHTDGYWYVREENNTWHLAVTDEVVESSNRLGVESGRERRGS